MFFDCHIVVDGKYGIVNDRPLAAIGTTYILSKGIPKPSHSSQPIIVIDPAARGITISGILTASPEVVVGSLAAALNWCADNVPATKIVLIGTADAYRAAMMSPWLRRAYVDQLQLDNVIGAEAFPVGLLPANAQQMQICPQRRSYIYDFTNTEELAYLRLVERLLSAPPRPDRTGVGTRGLFHEVLKFTLSTADGRRILPLITTKRTWFAGIYHELVWFLRGSTDTTYLVENGVHIWDGNSTREYLDAYGLDHYKPGEVGPVYGFQWRHAGAEYVCKEIQEELDIEPNARGIDQIVKVIETLKRSPWDRRMIICSWNVAQLAKMALPPCHYSFQFHVDPDIDGTPKYLNCLVNMRSSDMFLGVPFNIASYALLTHMIADICGLTAGTLSLSMADCHLYRSHEDQARLLITRLPRQFPTITFPARKKSRTINDYSHEFKITDYTINGYCPHPTIHAPMAV